MTLRSSYLAATILAGLAAPAGFHSADAAPVSSRVVGTASSVGVINVKQLALGGGGGVQPNGADQVDAAFQLEFRLLPQARMVPIERRQAGAPAGETLAERIAPRASATAAFSKVTGFDALDHNDQRTLADLGNQFSLEPPDQALAVGNGFVLEAVNNALMVYDTAGNALLAAPVSMNRFFNQVSEYNRTTFQQGPFLSDPRAFYDASTQRFFVFEWATLNDASGNSLGISVQFVAVSQTSDPTGNFDLYNFETTNTSTPNCPCFPDYQQIGVDANGVYISQNQFGIFSGAYTGDKIYALPKAELVAGSPPTILEFPVLTNFFTVHPTVVPPGGSFAAEGNGTEYLVTSDADESFSGAAKSVSLFAISNTASLGTATPSLTLNSVSVPTERIANGATGGLPAAAQKDGSRPLGGPSGLNEPAPLLSSGDARVGSTPYYVNGDVWTVIGTTITRMGQANAAVAYLQIKASGGADAPKGKVKSQGYITASSGTVGLLYPALAMTASGVGGIGVTRVGTSLYPSTEIYPLDASGVGKRTLSGKGKLPDDGFTAYPEYGGAGVGRWGDYGAAAVDEAGNLWFGNEYIPPTTAARPRSSLANWGTYITHATP